MKVKFYKYNWKLFLYIRLNYQIIKNNHYIISLQRNVFYCLYI